MCITKKRDWSIGGQNVAHPKLSTIIIRSVRFSVTIYANFITTAA